MSWTVFLGILRDGQMPLVAHRASRLLAAVSGLGKAGPPCFLASWSRRVLSAHPELLCCHLQLPVCLSNPGVLCGKWDREPQASCLRGHSWCGSLPMRAHASVGPLLWSCWSSLGLETRVYSVLTWVRSVWVFFNFFIFIFIFFLLCWNWFLINLVHSLGCFNL